MCAFGTNRQPRGAALVIAMLVMAVLLLAGTTFLTISSTESQIALNERVSAQAMLLAEAATNKAIAQLDANPGYTGETNTSLGGGTFTISVTTAAGCTSTPPSARNLVATASVPVRGGQAQVKLQATVDQVSYPFRWGAFAIKGDSGTKELVLDDDSSVGSFDSSLGAYNATVSGTTNVGKQGHIGANADVYLERNVVVQGHVTAGGSISKKSGASVTGIETPSFFPSSFPPSETLPSVTPPSSSTVNKSVGTNQTLTLPTDDTTNCSITTRICSYRTMTFDRNASLKTSGGPVTIYVTGTSGEVVDVDKDVTFGASPGTDLRIITRSDLTAAPYPDFRAGDNFAFHGMLYGKNTDIYLGKNAKIFGSMIGRRFTTDTGAAIHYDQAMSNREVCHNGKYSILRGTWREVIPST